MESNKTKHHPENFFRSGVRRSLRKVAEQLTSRKSSNKHHVAPSEECHPNIKSPHTPIGGVRLLPAEITPNFPLSSMSGSGDSAFVFPPPPPEARRGKSRRRAELIVRNKSVENDLHGNVRPTLLSTKEGNFHRQKTNFNEDSPSVSHLSLGSDDQTPDSPPPSFKPPTPTRTRITSPMMSGSGSSSPILPHSRESSTSPKHNKSVEKVGKSGLVAMAPFAAARLSLKKRKDHKVTPPKESEPDTFHNLHRKAQSSLRQASNDKVRQHICYVMIAL